MRAPIRHVRDQIALRDDGSLTIACISDSHSVPHPNAMAQVTALDPDAIFHLGDIGDFGILDDFATIAPLYPVRGNIDGHNGPPDHLTLSLMADEQEVGRWLLTHIALRGPRLRSNIRDLAQTEKAQFVVCGHSHVPFLGMDRGLGVFNPGSIGPRRYPLPIVFGVIRLRDGQLSCQHLTCETGEPWMP